MNINQNNMDIIRFQIAKKNDYSRPYYATREIAESCITDFDEFPYKRFFRGDYTKTTPTVIEREAGWRPLNNNCYTFEQESKPCNAGFCWQYPCSTTHPCTADQALLKKQVDQGIEICESRCNVQDRKVVIAP